ncbi:MAG: class I SAM-dependent methyltransferase [Pyrinomonadaceae bacterium]
MAKTQKELAFIRNLYVQEEWTRRFTELVDKFIDLSDSENLLYLNAGTGGHALVLDEKHGENIDVFAACENDDLLAIARDKSSAVSSRVDFSTIRFEDDAFDAVITDASLVFPEEVESIIENSARIARNGGDVAVFLPSSGSYGEVFSVLWEVLFGENLGDDGATVEKLVNDLPKISELERIAERAGMVNVHTETAIEVFDFENGAQFIAAPLVEDFLLPIWLESLDEDEKDLVTEKLAQLIDTEDADLSFRFSVKATLLTGEKA